MEKVWSYGGREYSFEVGDCESMSLLCTAIEEVRESISGTGGLKGAEAMRMSCQTVRKFFDSVLDGRAEEICGKGLNFESHAAAYMSFIEYVNGEIDCCIRRLNAVGEKYLAKAAAIGA